MHSKIAALFQELEHSRQRILSVAEDYPIDQRSIKPAPYEWSMAQVIIHLAMTEMQILDYIQKKLAKEDLPTSTLRSWVRYMLVKLALRFRKKIKAPKQVISPPEIQFEAAVEEWAQTRKQWQLTLSQLPIHLLEKDIFKHPVAGYMNIRHTLGFMKDHVLHHIHQIKRIGRAIGK